MITPTKLRSQIAIEKKKIFFQRVNSINKLITIYLKVGLREYPLREYGSVFEPVDVIDYIMKEYEKAGWDVVLKKGDFWHCHKLIFAERTSDNC